MKSGNDQSYQGLHCLPFNLCRMIKHISFGLCLNFQAFLASENDLIQSNLSIHVKRDIFLAFQTGSCLLLYENSAESSGAFCTT